MCCTWHLIDLQRVDLPIRLFEIGGIVADKIRARIQALVCGSTLRTVRKLGVDFTSPSTTEVGVYDDAHVVEMAVDGAGVTTTTLLIDGGCTECRHIGRPICDTAWYATSREEPGLDKV